MSRDEKKLNKFRHEQSEEMRKAGLKRIAVVYPETDSPLLEDKGLNNVYLAEVRHFNRMQEAKA